MDEADAQTLPLEDRPTRGFKAFRLTASNFQIWDGSQEENLEAQLSAFADNLLPASTPESILFELLLKSGYDLNVSREVVTLENQEVFKIADGELLICLQEEITRETIRAMIALSPRRVLCLDKAFYGGDALLTNAELEMQNADIQFQTV